MANTGLGGTLVFSSGITGAAYRWKTIPPVERSVDDLDDTALDSAGFFETVPDDLQKVNDLSVECYADLKLDPTIGVAGTITITYPKQTGQNTNAIITGTGYIKSVSTPSMSAGARLMQTIVVHFDGKTGPTFTKAT